MGAYINKAELLKELSVIQDRPVHSAMQIIKVLPTIDLVKCGECEHYNGHEQYCEIDHFAQENGFCSDGKRRE